MKNTVLLVLSFGVVCLVCRAGMSQAPIAVASAAPQKNNQVKPVAYSNVDAQIADTLRQLTRLRLERAMQIETKVPGIYSPDDFKVIKGELATIDEQESKNGEVVDWFSTLMGLAQVSKSVADADWKRATVLRQQSADAFSDIDVEMTRLRAQLANLNLQRGKSAAIGSAEDRQNWALLYLAMEVQRLNDQVRILDARTR